MEMTGHCSQEQDRNEYVLTSDDDSLFDINVWQSRRTPENVEMQDLDSQMGSKKQKKKVRMEINGLTSPEPGMFRCTQSAAVCAESTSQSAHVLKCVKIPNKRHLHKRDGKGETLLHKACKRKNLAQVRVLIQAGISVNMEDYAGWTALHEASSVGDVAVVEELLKAGANVNTRSCDGVTPLHDAVSTGHYQVVKLLLQHGSNPSDRNLGGLSALDMAEDGNIKKMLLNFVKNEQPYEMPAQYKQPGATSEARCHMQLSCQSSFSPSYSDMANVQFKNSGDRDGAREHSGIHLRKKDTTTDNLNSSEAITGVLEEVGRNQTEMLTWPLTGPQDTDSYHAALTQIQSVLTDVLAKQHLEKNKLVQRCRSASDALRHHLLKIPLVSLASRQRNLVEILQKQIHLSDVYVTMKAKLSNQPSNHQRSTIMRPQPNHFSTKASTLAFSKLTEAHSCQKNLRQESPRQATWVSLSRSAPQNNAKDIALPRSPTLLQVEGKNSPPHTDVLNKTAASCQGSTPKHINIQVKGKKAQTWPEVNCRPLFKLLQRGLVPPGSALQLLFKDHWQLAHVLCDGSIQDSKGKLYLGPEQWLESVFGNNIPVSSAYAWDKVMFNGNPLSYLLNMEAEGNTPQTPPVDDEAAILNSLMKIKVIRLVEDEEFLPNAIMDYYWEKLLKNDCSESDNWGDELLL
uniref:Uncharacterized protein n=1 Tax=Monopterus albus TaxID=43700 RepID=A0A3Q3J0K7_MONAL|nr:uncharacterized protein LOC109959667 [Monopterus albus]XP_020454862.1 uncharacterized protein LOC109959667 [Monopterus albus]